MKSWLVEDVMTKAVVAVAQTASYRELVDLLVEHRFSAVPVVDDFQRVTGVVSEADLLRKIEYAGGAEQPRLFDGRRRRGERAKASARTAADLMSTPPVLARASTPLAAAARLMDNENVKRLPVVDELGRLVGIVTRGDLLKVHLRPDDEILADVQAGIVDPFLTDETKTVQADVSGGVVTFTGQVDRWSRSDLVDRLARRIPGVVDVLDELEYEYDDRTIPGTGVPFGVA